jgi:transposase InsO family protein
VRPPRAAEGVRENGTIESFNGKLPDEFLAREVFDTLPEATVLIERWRKAHNTVHPHTSPRGRPPAPESRRPQVACPRTGRSVTKVAAAGLEPATPGL